VHERELLRLDARLGQRVERRLLILRKPVGGPERRCAGVRVEVVDSDRPGRRALVVTRYRRRTLIAQA